MAHYLWAWALVLLCAAKFVATKECFTSSQTKAGNVTINCSAEKSDECCVKRCKNNKCSCGRDSDFCRSESDCCSYAKKCVDSKCVCNGPGGSCTENKHCCSDKCTKKSCECSAIGKYCGETLDCCFGSYCSAANKAKTNRCVAMVDVGGSCDKDEACFSGVCSGGKCACAPAKGACVRKIDCCALPGKPEGAVGCIGGICTDCIPSTSGPIKEFGDYCDKAGPSEACCIGKCRTKNVCDGPRKTGDYCVGDYECNTYHDCIKNKCTLTNCMPIGSNCDSSAKLDCCGGYCAKTGNSVVGYKYTCKDLPNGG